MLPEVGGLEWLIIAVVALIVVGPKDLPVMLRRLGQFVARLRGMAAEFRTSFDEMARQSELDDLRKEVEAMRKGQFLDMATQTEHVETEANSIVSDIEQEMAGVGVSLHTPSYQFEPPPVPVEISDAAATIPAGAPRKPRAKKAAAVAAEPVAKPPVAKRPASKPSSAKAPVAKSSAVRKPAAKAATKASAAKPLVEGGR